MAQNRKSLTMRLAALCLQFLLLLALLVQLLVINCALFYGYIPLPARQINGYLSTHSIHDLRLVASSYKLRIDGQIEAFDLQMFH